MSHHYAAANDDAALDGLDGMARHAMPPNAKYTLCLLLPIYSKSTRVSYTPSTSTLCTADRTNSRHHEVIHWIHWYAVYLRYIYAYRSTVLQLSLDVPNTSS